MILTQKFLEQLFPVFGQESVQEQTELVYDGHHFNAELDKNENDELKIVIKYNREKSLRDKFEEWCDTVDDDIFVEACEKFEELTGKSLAEAEEEQLYDMFQSVVKEVVKNRIQDLSKRYL